MTTRRMTIVLVILALLAAALVVVSLTAGRGDAAGETSVSVNVPYKKPFMWRKCQSESGNNCWWRDSDGEPPNFSFYAVPIGKRKCLHYWRPRVNQKYGFCTRPDAKAPTG